MDAVQVVRTCYLAAVAGALVLTAIPSLKNAYLPYGARTTLSMETKGKDTSLEPAQQDPSSPGPLRKLVDGVVRYQVPRAYFRHFYMVSVASSLFWGFQILTKGWALRMIANHVKRNHSSASMTFDQVSLMWTLLLVQGSRRLREETSISKKSSSTMPSSHYLLGFLYYIGLGVAIWIEGSSAILSRKSLLPGPIFAAPSPKTMLAVPLFFFASGIQHDCHSYLASLPKYTLPVHSAFSQLICPHYTAECGIYVALMVLGAPPDQIINGTMLTVLVFVVANLATTANMTRDWTAKKFGPESIAGKWRMIPYVW